MSERERTGDRDLLYSEWHRTDALKRYIGHREAFDCAVIDIDWCEVCRKCKQPLALVEAQCSDHAPKDASITSALARMAGIAAYSISYSKTADELDIEWFRVRQLVPTRSDVEKLLPEEWARRLFDMRTDHEAAACSHPQARRAAPKVESGEAATREGAVPGDAEVPTAPHPDDSSPDSLTFSVAGLRAEVEAWVTFEPSQIVDQMQAAELAKYRAFALTVFNHASATIDYIDAPARLKAVKP